MICRTERFTHSCLGPPSASRASSPLRQTREGSMEPNSNIPASRAPFAFSEPNIIVIVMPDIMSTTYRLRGDADGPWDWTPTFISLWPPLHSLNPMVSSPPSTTNLRRIVAELPRRTEEARTDRRGRVRVQPGHHLLGVRAAVLRRRHPR